MSSEDEQFMSKQSLEMMAAATKVGKVSPEVQGFISASAEYYLLDVIENANMFSHKLLRSRLTGDDIQMAFKQMGEPHLYTFYASDQGRAGEDTRDEMARASRRVDLRKVANAPLPVAPVEPHFEMHWLAIDGKQPLIPQNPTPSLEPKGDADDGGKGSRESSDMEDGKSRGRAGEDEQPSQARLSEQLTAYLRRSCKAVLSGSPADRERALASLRGDPGLQLLLPHLCAFIQSKVTEQLKASKDPDQLAALLQMMHCILENQHFAFLEIYLDRLIPCLMSCLLHRDFEPAKDAATATATAAGRQHPATRHENGPPSRIPRRWDHWKVRDYAAGLICEICVRHGQTYPTLHARAIHMCNVQLARPKTPLTTLYGAIKGLSRLGALTVEQTLVPIMDDLATRIRVACEAALVERNPMRVDEANQCRMVLLQAAGRKIIASCSEVWKSERGAGSWPRSAQNVAAGTRTSPAGARGNHSPSSRKRPRLRLRAEDGPAVGSGTRASGSGSAGQQDSSAPGVSGEAGSDRLAGQGDSDRILEDRDFGADQLVPFYVSGQARAEVAPAQWITDLHRMSV